MQILPFQHRVMQLNVIKKDRDVKRQGFQSNRKFIFFYISYNDATHCYKQRQKY